MMRLVTFGVLMVLSGVHASVPTSYPLNDTLTSVTASISEPMSTLELCAAPSMSQLCTGDATLAGAVTRLTYVCVSKTRKTITVTSTETVILTPTVTLAPVTPEPPAPSFKEGETQVITVTSTVNYATSPEPTTTTTIRKTITVYQTVTIPPTRVSSRTNGLNESITSSKQAITWSSAGSTGERYVTISTHFLHV
ncbi:hypothetical protein K504DRAFT_197601 [Pleomassaria siparia CBS 279.74]|uniref:Uncharacterized protein n=1 Tax=Pleomassaria siparia CBS 279.74 TaxID=1314801 RepID=A0A6G1KH25_9PLEO|nr:hypothetical protein K504DRAFT_197601 [Pleomassaria siparia CBS 279.74]